MRPLDNAFGDYERLIPLVPTINMHFVFGRVASALSSVVPNVSHCLRKNVTGRGRVAGMALEPQTSSAIGAREGKEAPADHGKLRAAYDQCRSTS
jgi:hypothetical protein